MSYRGEAMALLTEHAAVERDARHGTIWRFKKTGKTVLVAHHDRHTKKDENDWAWRAVLGDVKRALRTEEEKKMADPTKPPHAHAVTAPNYPGNGAGGGQKLGLNVVTKAKRVVLEELSSALELAPYQIKALLARESVPVPDDIKLAVNAQGYLRITWSSTRESVEE